MPKVNISEATLEMEERALDLCECGAVPHEEYEPYCLHCGMHWEDVEAGVFDTFDD